MTNETGYLTVDIEPTRVFTALAGEDITQGMIVKSTGSTELSRTGELAEDLGVSICDNTNDYKLVSGIALNTAASGEPVAVAQDGAYRLQVGTAGTVTVGNKVVASNTAEEPYSVEDADASADELYVIGTALSGANAADEYVVISLNV